ncbi:extracellular solute-binding protein [Thiohalocapsa sp. ML1]|jgi:iron(III) transport system substrate-binding protein|uniref:extracellular solute-binding protein n=1 Tax=Thiohalocapsa sp. ML1 TaxID=1431688 RepID=UPI00073215F9|nr:extracellular solute-binding protein [Thiohalocapsa sp. ML1]
MPVKPLLPLMALCLGLGLAANAVAEPIRVISDRTPAHLTGLFEHYEKTRGVDIEAVFVDKGLLARLQSRPTEADLVVTKTADLLEEAKAAGLLRPFASETIGSGIRPELRDPDDTWVTLSYRPRAIFVSKSRVKPGEISTYQDLADPKWQGRVCIRSGYHDYNLSLFSQMAADKGLEETRAFIAGLHRNLAHAPNGNDRAQARGLHEGVCDLAVVNSYYMPIMMSTEEQRPWGESATVIFPDQGQGGAYIMRGGAALTTADDRVAEATRLLEFLVSDEAQEFIVNTTFEYPVRDSVALPEAVRALGEGQPGVSEGRFEARFVPLADVVKQRDAVVGILDEINFDGR